MTMQLSMMLTANSKQAQAELVKVAGQLEKVGVSAKEVGTKGKAGTTQLATGARQAAVATQSLAAAQQTAAATGNQMKVANQGAAGSMGNLISQFNDVGVMMAAGQNPLQLALQQGTQITQVIGPMGAAGAVRALGSAFIGMLNPVSLFTIGAIAAGAAVVQWATAGTEVKTLADQVVELEETMSSYKDIADLATSSTQDLEAKFGSAASGIRQTVSMLEMISRNEAQRTIDGISKSLSELMGIRGDGDQRLGVAEFFDVNIGLAFTDAQREARKEARLLTAEFVSQQDALSNASGDLEAQIAIMQQIVATTQQLAAAKDGVSAEEEAMLKDMGQTLLLMQQQRGAVEEVATALDATTLAAQRANAEYARSRIESDAAVTSAQQLLAQLNQEAEMRAAISMYGEDSRQVAELRVAAERRVFEEMVAGLGVSESMKQELLASWSAANGLAGTNMSAGIIAAAQEAAVLAENLGIAYGEAVKLRAARAAPYVASGRGGDPRQFDSENRFGSVYQPSAEAVAGEIDLRRSSVRTRRSGGGGGGSGRGISEQVDQVAQLTERLRDELAVMRESDPVQKELLRNREALATATGAERQTITDLISQRIEETRVLEAQEEQWNFVSSTATEALDALIVQGESLSDVLKKVVANLIDAGIQAAVLGTGPLASLFGGTDSKGRGGWAGDLFGAIFGGGDKKAAPQKLATGGMIYGPGTGTSDSVPVWGSSGEFIVNASATAKNRALLEAINAGGSMAAFAKGGALDGSKASGGRDGGGTSAHFTFDLRGAQGNAEVEQASYKGMQKALEEFSRSVLPERVQQIKADPRMIG